jgi:hypothetical protein
MCFALGTDLLPGFLEAIAGGTFNFRACYGSDYGTRIEVDFSKASLKPQYGQWTWYGSIIWPENIFEPDNKPIWSQTNRPRATLMGCWATGIERMTRRNKPIKIKNPKKGGKETDAFLDVELEFCISLGVEMALETPDVVVTFSGGPKGSFDIGGAYMSAHGKIWGVVTFPDVEFTRWSMPPFKSGPTRYDVFWDVRLGFQGQDFCNLRGDIIEDGTWVCESVEYVVDTVGLADTLGLAPSAAGGPPRRRTNGGCKLMDIRCHSNRYFR